MYQHEEFARTNMLQYGYMPEEWASIRKYTTENGIASAVRHLAWVGSEKGVRVNSQKTQNEYLQKVKELVKDGGASCSRDDEIKDEMKKSFIQSW